MPRSVEWGICFGACRILFEQSQSKPISIASKLGRTPATWGRLLCPCATPQTNGMRYKGWSQICLICRGEFLMRRLISISLLALASFQVTAQSVFPMRPDDPHAVYLERGAFGAVADGQGGRYCGDPGRNRSRRRDDRRKASSLSPKADIGSATRFTFGRGFGLLVTAHIAPCLFWEQTHPDTRRATSFWEPADTCCSLLRGVRQRASP